MYMEERKRNNLIDLIKGLLIVFVMIGHFLPGTLSENPLRYIIYSFHMPVFFFISGMLYSGHTSLKEYGLRLGIPWLFAVQVYYVLLNFRWPYQLSLVSYLRAYITPYYHLWFVIGFFFCIIMTKLCNRNKRLLFGLSVVFVIMSVVLKGNAFIIWKFVEYTIRPQFLLFFAVGLLTQTGGGGAKRLKSRCHFSSLVRHIYTSGIPTSRDLVGATG